MLICQVSYKIREGNDLLGSQLSVATVQRV